ncbi:MULTISPECIES: hypothetical protein [Glutamicibacter]|uniref:hypothetical protein n=1 Tax=Glutamicibacter TaxID=1742989 RepID=UPI00093AD827|nr:MULTISPECIES: hypothetical protein [Glutamicibacter]QEP06342.1 hypothetical protein F0M17_03315 [Glutamicibacter sp. ZJUTW]UTM48263.1 hypothetical protein XH9_05510 [Glutamicibacter mysorens]
MLTFQCDSGDNRHKVNMMETTLQVVEQLWQQVVEQFTCRTQHAEQLRRLVIQHQRLASEEKSRFTSTK